MVLVLFVADRLKLFFDELLEMEKKFPFRVSVHGRFDARSFGATGGRRAEQAQNQMVEGGRRSGKLWSK